MFNTMKYLVITIGIILAPIIGIWMNFFMDPNRAMVLNHISDVPPIRHVVYTQPDVVQSYLVSLDYRVPVKYPIPDRKPDLVAMTIDMDAIIVPATLIKSTNCESKKNNELISMACNLYHEARGEGVLGMIAVAEVVMNRVNASHYPDDVVGVVWQKHQFSWTNDGKSDITNEMEPWENALKVAQWFLDDNSSNITQGALYYHNDTVSPRWSKVFAQTVSIGNHIFYRYS